MIQQNAAATEELSSQAEQRQETIAFFKVDMRGSGVMRKAAAPKRTKTAAVARVTAGKGSGLMLDMKPTKDKRGEEFELF